MGSEELVELARQHRSSGAVLKIKVSNVRSRSPKAVIAVVEGVDDVGPYDEWIRRVRNDCTIEFVPSKGKSQVLDFRKRIWSDRTGLTVGTYMFVDRDFDGLRGQPTGDDIFCTSAYSIENYMVAESVLRSILADEFRCTAETNHRDKIVQLFWRVSHEFNREMMEANRRLFRARRLGISGPGIKSSVSKYVDVQPHGIRRKYDEEKLRKLMTFAREPSPMEVASIDVEFSALDPLVSYRGKFLLEFFLKWLVTLAEERSKPDQKLFPETGRVTFSIARLSLRSLASRAPMPDGLERFVQGMKAPR